jgi:hypothetical protein
MQPSPLASACSFGAGGGRWLGLRPSSLPTVGYDTLSLEVVQIPRPVLMQFSHFGLLPSHYGLKLMTVPASTKVLTFSFLCLHEEQASIVRSPSRDFFVGRVDDASSADIFSSMLRVTRPLLRNLQETSPDESKKLFNVLEFLGGILN